VGKRASRVPLQIPYINPDRREQPNLPRPCPCPITRAVTVVEMWPLNRSWTHGRDLELGWELELETLHGGWWWYAWAIIIVKRRDENRNGFLYRSEGGGPLMRLQLHRIVLQRIAYRRLDVDGFIGLRRWENV